MSNNKTATDRVTKSLIIQHTTGLHCRPSASFVRVANRFKSEILVEKDGETVNGKSIIGLMMLAASQGSRIDVTAIGPDAVLAIDTLENLVNNDFNLAA